MEKLILYLVIGYLIVVVSVVTGIAVNQFLYPELGSLPWFFELWPLFVFERAIFILFSTCSEYHCLSYHALWQFQTEIPRLLIILIIQCIFYLILGT